MAKVNITPELIDENADLKSDLDAAYERIHELQKQVETLLDAVHKAVGDLNRVLDSIHD